MVVVSTGATLGAYVADLEAAATCKSVTGVDWDTKHWPCSSSSLSSCSSRSSADCSAADDPGAGRGAGGLGSSEGSRRADGSSGHRQRFENKGPVGCPPPEALPVFRPFSQEGQGGDEGMDGGEAAGQLERVLRLFVYGAPKARLRVRHQLQRDWDDDNDWFAA